MGKVTDCGMPGKDLLGTHPYGRKQTRDKLLIFVTQGSHFSTAPVSILLRPFYI
jgi:hypothetical protein